MKAGIEGSEWYPVWTLHTDDLEIQPILYNVPEDLVLRAQEAEHAFNKVQADLRAIVDPLCVDCQHPGNRHQFSREGNSAQEPGSTICLVRDGQPSRRCSCTTPTPPNPHRVQED